MSSSIIKQVEEKSVAHEITLMVWCNCMDLVAVATIKGEVILHRLTKTKAWELNPPSEGITVKGISWRPDGKIIAIAYSSGQILLVQVENKQILTTIELTSELTFIDWIQEVPKPKEFSIFLDNFEVEFENHFYKDVSSKFIRDPSSSNIESTSSSDKKQNFNLLKQQVNLNFLIIGTQDGLIHLYIFGCFLCVTIDLNQRLNFQCSIESVHIIENFNLILVTIRDETNNIKIVVINSHLLGSHTKQLYDVALIYVKVTSLTNYLSNTITTITETWESILLEMDNKLSKYASKVPEGGVTADFLDLLTFGICSVEMEDFLVHDLTKKGLEKFGQTIEMSYSNIQMLLLKYVTQYGQNITYYLNDLRGLSRFTPKYGILGLNEKIITEGISANGSFLIKVGELQQIINLSILNYKAFFRWLFTAIMILMDEQVPNEIPKMTQQDLVYITEFLQNFDNIGCKNDGSKSGFVMERVGQYLIDSPLTIKANLLGNAWSEFLKLNPCIEESEHILKHNEDMSLIQQFNFLKNVCIQVFETPKESISEQFEVIKLINCFNHDNSDKLTISHININDESVLFAFLQSPYHLNLLEIQTSSDNKDYHMKCGKFHFELYLSSDTYTDTNNNYNILDLQFYSKTNLSLLLQENNKNAALYQMPILEALETLKIIEINCNEIFQSNMLLEDVNGSNLSSKLYKNLDDFVASHLSVSGRRRVCIVLSETRRKFRLFEMEGEEEDEEDIDMSHNSISKEDISELDTISTN